MLLFSIVKIASATPFAWVVDAALGSAAAAPLVREEHLGSVVVERCRVPVREVRVGDCVDANGVLGVSDIEQEAVATARAARETDLRKDGDVVTLRRTGPRSVRIDVIVRRASQLLD